MGKESLIRSPFPDIKMSSDDRLHLQDLANHLITANLERFYQFTTVQQGRVDKARWKHVKSREQLSAYAERSTGTAGPWTGAGLPAMMCVGTLEGNMNDMMYGIMSEDMEAMRTKACYVEEPEGAAILASIVEPTEEKPFQTLVLKWIEREVPRSLNLAKNRDYIYLEGTGFLTASNGDRVGYHILHSVSFPQTYELPHRVRGNMSLTAFWRQTTPRTIEMYATGILDPQNDKLRKLVIPGMAIGFLYCVEYTHCGQMRKLLAMLAQAYEKYKQSGIPNKRDVCVACSTPADRATESSEGNSTCKLCYGHVCQSCKTVRKISFVDPDLTVRKRKIVFCMECISSVASMDAAECARAKVVARKKRGFHMSSSMFSDTSTSS